MDNEKAYHNSLKLSEAGRRLMKDEDYKLLINELEKDLARLWSELRDAPTTDPRIARIQGELNRLDDVIGRAKSWIELTANLAKTNIQKPNPDSDDYSVG